MIYNRKIYDSVKQKFEARQVTARRTKELRRTEIYSKIPEIKVIDEQIASAGIKLSRLALSGISNISAEIENIRQQNNMLISQKTELLAKNGFPHDYMISYYKCPKCSDTGYVDGVMCECFKAELINAAYENSNIAPALRNISFDNFDLTCYSNEYDAENKVIPREHIKDILCLCMKFITEFEKPECKNLLFTGNAGVGKTFTSAAVANEILKKGYIVMYYTAGELFNLLKTAEFSFGSEAAENKRTAYDADLIIIDDLGTEMTGQAGVSCFFEILNARMLSGKKIIINTNLGFRELQSLYSPRILSRISEFEYMKIVGSDIRWNKNIN